jgi:hypothetical protein
MWNTFDLRETLVGILHWRYIVKLNFKYSGINQRSTLNAHQQLLNNTTFMSEIGLRSTLRFSIYSHFFYEINKVKEKRSPMNGKMTTFKDAADEIFP